MPRTSKKATILACLPQKNIERCATESKCDCILAKVKGPWIKTGFFILNNQSPVKNLSNLDSEYSKLKKHEKRGSAADLAQQQDFKVYLNKIFMLAFLILGIKYKMTKRSDSDKLEDLEFLEDQDWERRFMLGSEDKKYRKNVFLLNQKKYIYIARLSNQKSLLNFQTQSGVDLTDFKCSQSTSS